MVASKLKEIAAKNDAYMKYMDYWELCEILGLTPLKHGYKQRQLKELGKVFNLRHKKNRWGEYKYILIDNLENTPAQFLVPDELKNNGGIYIIEHPAYEPYIGKTANYRKRFLNLKSGSENTTPAKMIKDGGTFKNI